MMKNLILRALSPESSIIKQKRWFRHFSNQCLSKDLEKNNIEVVQQGSIMTIAINLPETKNILDQQTIIQLQTVIDSFNQCELGIAVLHGIGGNLCTGLDNSAHESLEPEKLLKVIEESEKPIVAAVSGFTTCFGFQLALACDLRVMEDTALFGFDARKQAEPLYQAFVNKLVACVGPSAASDIILTGRNITAKEAFAFTLANRIVSCGTSLGQAVQLAKCINKFPLAQVLQDRKKIVNSK